MGRILEGFWNCKYCGTTRIGGSKRECPNCGKPRGNETKFFLDTTEGRYVPEKQAASINRNPDWKCDYCGSLNSDSQRVCPSCGAPREETSLTYFENQVAERTSTKSNPDVQETKTQKSYPNIQTTNTRNSYSSYGNSSNSSRRSHTFKTEKNSFNWNNILIPLLIIILFIGIIFLLIPKELEVTIQEFYWSRNIDIQRYQTVQESDWSLPPDARLLYSQPEFSHYENVLDHYETKTRQVARERISHYETYVIGYRDLGNGYFEEITSERPVYETYYETETYEEEVYRQEPVYRTKYYYEVDKWLYERSVKTSNSGKSPYWGNTNLASDEKVYSKTETYTVLVTTEDNKKQSIHLSFEDWSSLKVGQTVKMKVSLTGYGEILDK